MNKRFFSGLLVIMFGFAIAAGIYYYPKANGTIPQSVVNDWLTYESNLYGFKFKYPFAWQSIGDGSAGAFLSPKTPVGMTKEVRAASNDAWPDFKILPLKNPNHLDVSTFFNQTILPNLRKDTDHKAHIVKIGGLYAMSYLEQGVFESQHYVAVSGEKAFEIVYVNEVTVPKLKDVYNRDINERVISTITFTK